MIIIKLRGGLGNQMFQYAFGKSEAVRTGAKLKLDLSWFSSPGAAHPPRKYGLDIFAAKPKAASKLEIAAAKLFGTYLSGFWQNPSYFESIAPELRRDFSFAGRLPQNAQTLRSGILGSVSICVHVRRSDYVEHDMFIGIDYYKKAVQKMLSLAPRAAFFIFSDDIEWCRRNLDFIPSPIFAGSEEAGLEYPDQFRLMTECRHFIIPNSTFSWWAAWLGATADKIVIAPETWRAGHGDVIRDIVPSAWIHA